MNMKVIKDIILSDLNTIDSIVNNEDISIPLLLTILVDISSSLRCITERLNEEKETNKKQ